MSSSWQEALRAAWLDLARHPAQSRQFRSRRLSESLPVDAYAALRAVDDAPCLLIEPAPSSDTSFEVGGMRLGIVAGDRGPLLVLSLEDRNRLDLFTTVCADALAAADTDRNTALSDFVVRLDAWRRFLRDRRSGLSRIETVGLLGELLVLTELLGLSAEALSEWKSPDDGLHDFERRGHALEIKTSLGSASSIRISRLDQLDSSGLRKLDLLHVKLIEAPDGNTLDDILARIRTMLSNDSALRTFDNALLRWGLMPDDTAARTIPRIQMRAIDGYHVDGDFPRLERSRLPQAVVEAEYQLDARALTAFSADAQSILREFSGGAEA
jgi:hypothetical protein